MKALISVIVLALVAWGLYAVFSNDEAEVTTPTDTQTYLTPATATGTATSSPTAIPEVKIFTVNGSNFAFSPTNMTVNKGDRVRVVFNNTGGNHDWVIDEFNTRTKVLSNGQSETVEFVADKTGTFEYYCSVGTHRQMGMKGSLIVK